MTLCLEMKQIAESICLISQKWEREIEFDSEDVQLKNEYLVHFDVSLGLDPIWIDDE